MKNIIISIFIMCVFFSCNQGEKTDDAENTAVGTEVQESGVMYKVITDKSGIQWTGRKITGKHEGTLNIKEGQFWVKDGELSGGKFILDMKSIVVTDLQGKDKEDLETHLMDTDFFETDNFPTGRFVITEVRKSDDAAFTHEIKGNLTLKGIIKGISFPAVINIENETLIANANFNINRSLWGITYKGKLDNAIKDEVNLSLMLEGKTE